MTDFWSTSADRPLASVRILSMEQAAALPFATRHMADLGAEVIRVQSHKRGGAGLGIEADATRSKQQLAIDLATPGGPEAFLRVAAGCDVVAHNFTPKVMRRDGIDYEGVRAVKPDMIYVALTGFGASGPWGEKPLFGPGAEAVSGHNLLIGEPDAWPGRPGTIVYADFTCGMNCTFAALAALEERDRTGHGQHVDISLYETAVSHFGPIIASVREEDGEGVVRGSGGSTSPSLLSRRATTCLRARSWKRGNYSATFPGRRGPRFGSRAGPSGPKAARSPRSGPHPPGQASTPKGSSPSGWSNIRVIQRRFREAPP